MNRILGALVCGVVIGAVGMASLPSEAHHARSQRKLKNRVERLELAIEGLRSDARRVEDRLSEVEGRTSYLASDGTYVGMIANPQVYSPVVTCGHADDAVWVEDDTDNQDISYLGCTRGAYRQAQ